MLPDTHVPMPQIDRCPSCSGATRPGAPWCTQCWTDLRPARPEPERSAADLLGPAVAGPGGGDAVVAADLDALPVGRHARHAAPAGPSAEASDVLVAEPASAAAADAEAAAVTWPCTRCGVANRIDATACACCGAGFLDDLRSADGPSLVLPVVGDVGRLSKGQRYGVAGVLVFLVLLVVALLGVLTG